MSDRNTQPEYPTLAYVLSAIAGWVNAIRTSTNQVEQFGRCSPYEVSAIARDLNISTADLRAISRKGPESADNLKKMLVALKVDPAALSKSDPAVMRDLQRLCVNCGHKQECSHELDAGSAAAHFHAFCPNAYTLDALFTPADKPAPELADHLRG